MPRMYIRPDTFLQHPVSMYGGYAFNGASTFGIGVLEGMIARASARIDNATNRKWGIPGTTTLSKAALAGATSLSLASLINLDDAPALLLQIGTGATQETVQIGTIHIPGAYALPIPGTVTLYAGSALQYNHSQGDPVVGYWYEQSNVRGGSTSNTDGYWDLTQEGQIGMAHSPRGGQGGIVRVVFLRGFPIQKILSITVTYPWANAQDPGVVSDVFDGYAEGWYRFPIGYYVPSDSVVWTAYRSGYDTMPDQIQEAVIFEVAGELAMARNPLGAISVGSGVRHVSWGSGKRANLFSTEAENICRMNKNLALG